MEFIIIHNSKESDIHKETLSLVFKNQSTYIRTSNELRNMMKKNENPLNIEKPFTEPTQETTYLILYTPSDSENNGLANYLKPLKEKK